MEKIEPLVTQMEQWSILSNVLYYVQHSRFNSMNHTLDVKTMNRYKSTPDIDREFKELDFGATPPNYKRNIWRYMREFTQI